MTAQDLIKSSYRLIGAIDAGEPLPADMAEDGLEALQLILDFWSGQGLMIYAQTSEYFTLNGSSSYTIGSGGDFNTTRPDQIAGAYFSDSGQDYSITIIDAGAYRAISDKAFSGITDRLFYNPTFPLGVIYIYPVSSGMLYLDSLKPLTEPATLTTVISLPPAYKRCIKLNLGIDLSPEYGKLVDPLIYKQAEEAKDAIISKNAASRAQVARLDVSWIGRNRGVVRGRSSGNALYIGGDIVVLEE